MHSREERRRPREGDRGRKRRQVGREERTDEDAGEGRQEKKRGVMRPKAGGQSQKRCGKVEKSGWRK